MLASLLLPAPVHGSACTERRRTASFAGSWSDLDDASTWRASFSQRTGDVRVRATKSYSQMLADYLELSRDGNPADPAQQLPKKLTSALGTFAQRLGDPLTTCEASHGIQETLGEVMMGQLLAGNDRLLRGLRTRYPKTGPDADPVYSQDPTRLLRESVAIFGAGIVPAMARLGAAPDALRASGRVNLEFPVWVENTPKVRGQTGELVENELYQLTQLVLRQGIASTSYGRRLFYLGNDKPEQRAAAAQIIKRAGHTAYLHSAVLAAVQAPGEYQQNFGPELRGVIGDAQSLFDDIRKGVNPLQQRADFVPDASVQELIDDVRITLTSAEGTEDAVREHRREYDEDFTKLEEELERQQGDGGPSGGGFLKKVYDEIGLTIDVAEPSWSLCDALDLAKAADTDPRRVGCEQEVYDLRTEEGQNATLLLAWDKASGNDPAGFMEDLLGCDADICVAYQEWIQASLEARRASQQITELWGQIAVEDERARKISRITSDTAVQHLAMDIADAVAAASPDVQTEFGADGVEFAETWKPADVISKALDIGRNWTDYLKESEINEADHAATVKNLHLQMAGLLTELDTAAKAETIARNRYTALVGDLQWVLAGFARAQKKLAKMYYTNPAYRMQMDEAELNADLAFEAAMIRSYLLSKRLEYEWGERLLNPVPLVGTSEKKPIGGSAKYNPITTAESAFAVASAGGESSPEPSLRTYLEALQLWDTELRNDPARPAGETSTKTFSLKSDLLGIVGDPEFTTLAFRRFVAKHRVPGQNPARQDLVIEFGVLIDDQLLFPFVPNLRIDSIAIDLRSASGRSVLGPNALNPPEIELVQGGQATIRSFAASQSDDRTLILDLPTPDEAALHQSQFYTIVSARVDGAGVSGNTPGPASGLRGRSPAATRWLLRIDMDKGANADLRLENLEDIRITFTTRWGEPVSFPSIL